MNSKSSLHGRQQRQKCICVLQFSLSLSLSLSSFFLSFSFYSYILLLPFWSYCTSIALSKVLVSATLTSGLKKLADFLLKDPTTIGFSEANSSDADAPNDIPLQLSQYYAEVPVGKRLVCLAALLRDHLLTSKNRVSCQMFFILTAHFSSLCYFIYLFFLYFILFYFVLFCFIFLYILYIFFFFFFNYYFYLFIYFFLFIFFLFFHHQNFSEDRTARPLYSLVPVMSQSSCPLCFAMRSGHRTPRRQKTVTTIFVVPFFFFFFFFPTLSVLKKRIKKKIKKIKKINKLK